ncbi:hydroxyphenylacetyl-CoA thioesterase PaaI [Nocardioides sp. LHG3406-4]|uniref:hydroxyphenylacetyl-CoA thioesterase PaaI n=1 Tax=Nocardioides sp. LHG3406-4 TaxID=2804575 RepID=UPI003CE9B6BF
MTPADLPGPDHMRRMWDNDRTSQALGMSLVSVAPGRAEMTMPVRDDMVNGHGIGHGGITFTLADSTFAFACNSHGPATVAHSASIRFHAPVRLGDVLTATAVERSHDGRRGVYDVEVRAGDRLVATFEGHATRLPEEPA